MAPGGAHSSFKFLNDSLNGPIYQHHISALSKGHYLLFDDGDNHYPPISRAVEYAVGLTNKIARPVWQFRDSPDKFTGWMGSAQRLANGSTLINFVLSQYPKVTEVDKTGAKRFAFRFTSINHVGIESPFSNEESVAVNIIRPGQNMVQNGDFAQKSNAWFFAVERGRRRGVDDP